jgi:hypothetical protein
LNSFKLRISNVANQTYIFLLNKTTERIIHSIQCCCNETSKKCFCSRMSSEKAECHILITRRAVLSIFLRSFCNVCFIRFTWDKKIKLLFLHLLELYCIVIIYYIGLLKYIEKDNIIIKHRDLSHIYTFLSELLQYNVT